MHSATCSIWSREMKLKVSDETGAVHAAASPSVMVTARALSIRRSRSFVCVSVMSRLSCICIT